ncbi:hypothetical protein FPSE_02734 [Fusarium pseudograminearum CS3096]|uniref:Uncharacterized protein n=1 Tax=Fusarium pseudograminearum (strain CS3096) TaxID=1028729 RepID=K3W261_FUSPC|nr:hypothetical protein FPSE_02734 [Fusarium pseudograminearum CS3096]EKJ77090.1 hypothetical protein FPSE_02734 [Fusarium pseudograminearum CS3096]
MGEQWNPGTEQDKAGGAQGLVKYRDRVLKNELRQIEWSLAQQKILQTPVATGISHPGTRPGKTLLGLD